MFVLLRLGFSDTVGIVHDAYVLLEGVDLTEVSVEALSVVLELHSSGHGCDGGCDGSSSVEEYSHGCFSAFI